eukprot:3193005-Rhodomonas_salina.2
MREAGEKRKRKKERKRRPDRFAGLRSRWTMEGLCWCRNATPANMSKHHTSASAPHILPSGLLCW